MLLSIEQSILAEETLANLWSFAKSANVSTLVSLHIVILLFISETGKTVSRAISTLEEHGVKVQKIIMVTLFATPQGEYL